MVVCERSFSIDNLAVLCGDEISGPGCFFQQISLCYQQRWLLRRNSAKAGLDCGLLKKHYQEDPGEEDVLSFQRLSGIQLKPSKPSQL